MPDWQKKGRNQIGKLMLKAINQKLDTQLFVDEFDNRYESLFKQSDYFITGSINWMSNSWEKNFERTWKHEFPVSADKEFEDANP